MKRRRCYVSWTEYCAMAIKAYGGDCEGVTATDEWRGVNRTVIVVRDGCGGIETYSPILDVDGRPYVRRIRERASA